ncbi:hypothetical protein [Novosphingobium acidiphilum]|jgi:hypothetical protein|uniref:hypothetical protein n=1 Tax=Novosphingobium acidiphilum TaxID=505248 RepID=UPI0003FEF97B|nr:hypothetical protein [Novosphingobium acidiphilum]
MKEFFSNVSPRRAVTDLWKVLGAPSEFRWRGMLLAAVVSGSIIYGLVGHEERALPHLPKIIYINSWRADRSEAEIIAGNIAASRKAHAEAAAEERQAADIRHMYKVVGAATGLDTETMDKKGQAERQAEDRARAAHDKALLDRYLQKGEKPVVDPAAPPAAAP